MQATRSFKPAALPPNQSHMQMYRNIRGCLHWVRASTGSAPCTAAATTLPPPVSQHTSLVAFASSFDRRPAMAGLDKPRLWLQVASRCLTPLPMIWSPKNHIAGSHTRQTAEPCSRERQPCPWRHKQTTHYRLLFHNHSVGTPVHTLTFTRHTPSAAHSSISPQTTFCTLLLSFLHTR
jgi:hypothetical protein